MDKELFRGRWNEVQGQIKSEWHKLTDNEVGRIDGDLDRFRIVLQDRYAYSKEQAKEVVENFLKRFER